jgi:hypothetical protein
MRIIHKFLFVLLLAALFAGCNDVVDFDQPGNLPAEDAIQSVDDMNNAIGGLYANLDELDNIYFNSVHTDEITIGQGNGGQGLGGQYQFVLDETSDIAATVWIESYRSINELNRYIQAAQEITPEDGQQDLYNDLLGQAYAMRAYEYFTLLSFYSPDLTDDASPGVITFTDVPGPNEQRPRSTTGESFNRILDDLDTAESNIDPNATSVTRFTQTAITALRARIAAYRGQYPQAETLSQEVLDQVSLAQPQAYADMYTQDTDGEAIFKLARVPNGPYDDQPDIGDPAGSGWIGSVYAQVTVTQGSHYQLDANLYNLYDQDDIRRDIVALEETVDGVPYLFVSKYPGTVVSLHSDQKIFRASEMALINAEAKVAQNDLPGAALVIQNLRSARNTAGNAPLPTYANQQEGFADVLLERRKELALEGHRWHDLARIGEEANAVIDRAETGPGPAGCSDYGACVGPVPGDSEKYTLPIPISEINANAEIEQNPGYIE